MLFALFLFYTFTFLFLALPQSPSIFSPLLSIIFLILTPTPLDSITKTFYQNLTHISSEWMISL